MLKVVVQTIETLTMNAVAAAKTGRQRAATHNKGANNTATAPTVAKSSERENIASPLASASAATAKVPSTISLKGGRSRQADDSSMSNGATVMIPNASEANHCCHAVNIGVVVL